MSLDEVIGGIVKAEVVADALPRHRAAYVATYVFTVGLIEENSRKMLTNNRPQFSASQLLSWDGIGAASSGVNVLREKMWTPDFAIGEILKMCFAHARHDDFIDTDEIVTLVGASYAAGVVTRRQFPRLARTWMERRIAA
jgi:hypothetical protein